jgi:hypothetical protein
MASARGKGMRGAKHPFWKGGSTKRPYELRVLIKKIVVQKNHCERCGKTSTLQGHHKIPYSTGTSSRNDPANIEVICADCHAKEHPKLAGMIARPRFRSGVILNCKICENSFYVPKYKESTAKTCSKSCSMKYLHNQLRSKRLKSSPSPLLEKSHRQT